ncbi:gamma-glutamyltranspeptidase [Monoraphidium neglectum]|uniref:Gamma-glutamyltranspeptidase n=1 Tax=Monoraphidium neglectum TaxID=145388 RepID=A0A0D2MKF6_9CHLO|nr:gamma-glutamyltranspeptidase [Monoraphidium neglectum]KIZ03435.1 gamma-glutamyltranspeptidase [Monoraphidium neglectum]|eukprot:XP_013902454.1 gamma-glutamyltranspeptidase [Monoraphidium neglectum]
MPSYTQFVASTTDDSKLSYDSRRSCTYGTQGMVSASQPAAAQAALRVLQSGGNAADAAVAAAVALAVTEPCHTGLGGDAFALFFDAKSKKVLGLAGNGAAPAGLSLEAVRAKGVQGGELPMFSALTVTVPGAARLWEDAVGRWGSGNKSLGDVLQPAIELAEGGFAVGPTTAWTWSRTAFQIIDQKCGDSAAPLLASGGRGPRAGELLKNEPLAAVLRELADSGPAKAIYSGRVAEAIVEAVQSRGGVMTLADLAAHRTLVVEPISTEYRGATVWEVPPPCQGLVALLALNILEADAALASKPPGSADRLHSLIESVRLGFADALAYNCDPAAAAGVEPPAPVAPLTSAAGADDGVAAAPRHPLLGSLLSKERASARRAAAFDGSKACVASEDAALGPAREAAGGDTVYVCVVDREGNGCSLINSNYMGFGTGIVPKGCGFTLQNRGHNFSLNPAHPNCLAPGKRPYHTIMPAMVTRNGELQGVIGVVGGTAQPQGQVQVLSNILDLGMNPQAALDAPRFCVDRADSTVGAASVAESHVFLEEGVTQEAAEKLRAMGHDVVGWPVEGQGRTVFGRGQVIWRDLETGVLSGASDPRNDGCAIGY